jgi:mono/diheme cytochrome c family protein
MRARPRRRFSGHAGPRARLRAAAAGPLATAAVVASLAPLAALLPACALPPAWPARHLEAPRDPAAVERGRYLAEHLCVCVTCHSERDWRYYGGPAVPGTDAAGGVDTFDEVFHLPEGVSIPASNLSPHALGDWSDGEIYRAITGGLSADGHALFPTMPYFQYRRMARSDLEAIVSYLRVIPANSHEPPARDLRYRVLSDLTNTFPIAPSPPAEPPQRGTREYGKYLAVQGGCWWCHTPIDKLGWPIPGTDWSGGNAFTVPEPGGGTVWAPNISPDESGIGAWTRETFVRRFKSATPDAVRQSAIQPGGFNTVMAWPAYSGLSEEDLGSLYEFLMSRRPIRKLVKRWEPRALVKPPVETPPEPGAAAD